MSMLHQFSKTRCSKTLSSVHDRYVVLLADKAQHCFCLQNVLHPMISKVDVENNSNDKTYTAITLSKGKIVNNHKSVVSSFGLYTKDDDCDLPSLYCISRLHKNPYKQLFIAESAKCTTIPLSKLLHS